MVLRSNVGAGGGKAAQHSQSLEAWIMHVPGLKLAMPSTPSDAKGLLKTAIRDNNPVVFLEHKLLYFTKEVVPEDDFTIPFGVAKIRRHGRDVTVVAMQAMLSKAISVASELAEENIDLEIIDPRTLVPLDIETIVHSVKKTNRLVIVHEAVERGGWAGEIAMQVIEHAFDDLAAPIVRICGKSVPMPYSSTLERVVIPSDEGIKESIRTLVKCW
jgi:pyruvate dehydrogenase E1 component beta subunit